MKKINIVIGIIIFGLFAFFGYKVASTLFAPDVDATNTEVPTEVVQTGSPTQVPQQNYLLIHVTDMTVEKPELISVWAVFIYQTTPPQFMFVPLFPSYDAAVQRRLDRKFSLTKDLQPSSWFLSQVEKSYDMQVSGYILSDNAGVGYAGQWLTGQVTANASVPAVSDNEKHLMRLTGQTAYQQVCALFSTNTANNFFSAIDWTLLLPSHFSTDLTFDTISLTTNQVIRASSPVQCEVLSNE
mgnify:FL=1